MSGLTEIKLKSLFTFQRVSFQTKVVKRGDLLKLKIRLTLIKRKSCYLHKAESRWALCALENLLKCVVLLLQVVEEAPSDSEEVCLSLKYIHILLLIVAIKTSVLFCIERLVCFILSFILLLVIIV